MSGFDASGEAPPASLPGSMVECPICLLLICEPVSLACGHTTCRACLLKSLAHTKKKCPMCRSPCVVNALEHGENVMLARIASSLWPEQYKARLEESKKVCSEWTLMLPAFLYNEVLFPGGTLRLHLFEPRYRLMIQRVMASSRRFAYIACPSGFSSQAGKVIVVAEITECEMLSDGRSLIEAKLVERAYMESSYVEDGTQGLLYCSLKSFKDEPLSREDMPEAAKLVEKCSPLREWCMNHRGHQDGPLVLSSDMETASFQLAGLLARTTDSGTLEAMLSCTNTLDRLKRVLGAAFAMRSMCPFVRRREEEGQGQQQPDPV